MRRAAGDPTGSDLAAASLAPELRHPEPVPPTGRQAGQRGEHRRRSAGERLVRPGLVVGHELGDEAVVAERAVVGGHDVLDLVGQEARRVDLAGRRRPEEQGHLATGPDRLVGQHPDAGHPEAARDEQEVPAPRVDLERAPERPEQVDLVTGPQPREPVRATSDDPEVDRDDARRRIRRVERERPTQDHPGEIPGPDVDELAGPRADRQVRGVVGLQPLAGQDLATVDQLRRRQPHRHALGSSSAPASGAGASLPLAASLAAAVPSRSGAAAGKASASASARSPKTSVGS